MAEFDWYGDGKPVGGYGMRSNSDYTIEDAVNALGMGGGSGGAGVSTLGALTTFHIAGTGSDIADNLEFDTVNMNNNEAFKYPRFRIPCNGLNGAAYSDSVALLCGTFVYDNSGSDQVLCDAKKFTMGNVYWASTDRLNAQLSGYFNLYGVVYMDGLDLYFVGTSNGGTNADKAIQDLKTKLSEFKWIDLSVMGANLINAINNFSS